MANKELSVLDMLNVFGLYLGILNYEENIGQTDFNNNIKDIQKHLSEQDNKIDKIIKILGGVEDER